MAWPSTAHDNAGATGAKAAGCNTLFASSNNEVRHPRALHQEAQGCHGPHKFILCREKAPLGHFLAIYDIKPPIIQKIVSVLLAFGQPACETNRWKHETLARHERLASSSAALRTERRINCN